MIFVFGETEEFRRGVASRGIKRMEISARAFLNESKLGQKPPIKPSCHFHVFYPQIDMIKVSRFHLFLAIFDLCEAPSVSTPTRLHQVHTALHRRIQAA